MYAIRIEIAVCTYKAELRLEILDKAVFIYIYIYIRVRARLQNWIKILYYRGIFISIFRECGNFRLCLHKRSDYVDTVRKSRNGKNGGKKQSRCERIFSAVLYDWCSDAELFCFV